MIPYKYSVFPDQPQIPQLKLEVSWSLSYPIKIVDISYHQDPSKIDYDKLAASADGFILRAAYGTGVEGKWYGTDPAFNKHYEELYIKRGKPCGAYHYIVAYKPISEQVEVMYNAVKGKKLALGLWCDVELEKNADPLTAKHVIEYMTQAEAKMGRFGIYNGHWCWMDIMGAEEGRYADRKLWMSAYTASPDDYIPHGWNKWWLWQYTSSARLPGYYGNLDVSYFHGSKAEFNAWIGGNVLLDIQPLSQRDPRWASIQLGTSTSTIGSHGCLMTDMTMFLRYLGLNMTPAEVNAWLKANGGYNGGNLFVWGSVSKLLPGLTFGHRYTEPYLDKIDEQLVAGRPVIVNVDGTPATAALDEHWILIVGKENGYYIINDPIDGSRMRFNDRYGDPKTKIYIICTYNFTGTVPPPVVIPPEEEGDVLYRVKIKNGITQLVIRSGPSSIAPVVFRYATGEYDVFEEKKDILSGTMYGRIGIGRWISLDPDYVEKIGTPTSPSDSDKLERLWKAHPELH